jgi:hypothetical protein
MISWLVYKGEAVPALTGGDTYTISNSSSYADWDKSIHSRSIVNKITPSGTFVTDAETYSITFLTVTGPSNSRRQTTTETVVKRSTSFGTYTSDYPSEWRVVVGYTSTTVSAFSEWLWTEDEYGNGDYIETTYTREAAKAVTAQTQTTTSLWTTKTTTGASGSTTGTITQFTTSTQNRSALGISGKTEVSTEVSVITTGSTVKSYVHGHDKFDVIIQADPGEVLYVVGADKINFWQGAARPFLTEIASTSTRITISHTPAITTSANTYTSSTPFQTYPSSNIWLTSEITETYRQITTITAPTVTVTDYEGVVPTPTRTATYNFFGATEYSITTTTGTFTVAITTGSTVGNMTVVYKRLGKMPRITKETRYVGWSEPVTETGLPTWMTARYFNVPYDKTPIFTYDEIIVTATSSYAISGYPINFSIDTGPTPEFPLTNLNGETSPLRYGRSFEGNHYRVADPQYKFAPDYFGDEGEVHLTQLRPYGVMTSPDEFYGRLEINQTTLLNGTIFSTVTQSVNGQRITTTATTTTNINSSFSTTTYATRTTTFSPTYARFHRSDGGLVLRPTSGDSTAYTADLTAVTYTSGPTSNPTTTSEVVSAIESGVTRVFFTRAAGGAAGFRETNYNYIRGFCKINGSKSFFPATSVKTITESTAVASYIEFPYVIGVGANNPGNNAGNGPFYYPGSYSYTDILND